MPFYPLITATIETALNRLVQSDSDLVRQCSRLKGKVLQLHIKEFDKTLTFIFSQQIDVLGQYEGEPDCYLSVSLKTLPQLREQANITQLIKQDLLVLEGDIQLAQKFATLLTDAKPDIEEWLSQWVGDALAHTVAHTGRQLFDTFKQQADKHQRHLAQVLTEEWKVAPGPLEVAYFCDQVDDVNQQAAQVESRLNALAEKI
ncbi:SCP2 domain-containing protein [Vibrio sp.]|nr:SCP2 domain-containing protein [Vibrio sp.]